MQNSIKPVAETSANPLHVPQGLCGWKSVGLGFAPPPPPAQQGWRWQDYHQDSGGLDSAVLLN